MLRNANIPPKIGAQTPPDFTPGWCNTSRLTRVPPNLVLVLNLVVQNVSELNICFKKLRFSKKKKKFHLFFSFKPLIAAVKYCSC